MLFNLKRGNIMNDIITLSELNKCAKESLFCCLDYIASHTIYSPWTQKTTGWQEQWLHSHFSGLYATCNALSLLANYKNEYSETINNVIEELKYLFDTSIDYTDFENDDENERKRKARCRFLLEQNCNTTLKMVYFIRAYEQLKKNEALNDEDSKLATVVEQLYDTLDRLFISNYGFVPAIGNETEISVLTTAQTFILMAKKWGADSDKTEKSKELLIGYINDYFDYIKNNEDNSSKFKEYSVKSNFVSAFYALAHSTECLTEDDKELILSAFFESLNDRKFREGFIIKDSYTVPNTVMARDTYSADARMLYLKAIVRLMLEGFVPDVAVDLFLDDFVEIIDTCYEKKQYLAWDSAPSFSHNIKGLKILHDLTKFLDRTNMDFTAYKAFPRLQNPDYQTIDPLNVVLFMSFSKEYTESLQETIQEVMQCLGFNVWWATNDPYDVSVVDSILDRLSKAQFVIVDCTERSANVMYEAGLSHGLGKPTLLCGCGSEVFPYEDDEFTDTCIFNSNGDENPPPYRDLQKGILEYIKKNINDFCLSEVQKKNVFEKAEEFINDYCV